MWPCAEITGAKVGYELVLPDRETIVRMFRAPRNRLLSWLTASTTGAASPSGPFVRQQSVLEVVRPEGAVVDIDLRHQRRSELVLEIAVDLDDY